MKKRTLVIGAIAVTTMVAGGWALAQSVGSPGAPGPGFMRGMGHGGMGHGGMGPGPRKGMHGRAQHSMGPGMMNGMGGHGPGTGKATGMRGPEAPPYTESVRE